MTFERSLTNRKILTVRRLKSTKSWVQILDNAAYGMYAKLSFTRKEIKVAKWAHYKIIEK